jgi:hypothetical protein
MRYSITTLTLGAALSLSSCFLNPNKEEKKSGKVDLQIISINKEYSMGIPTYMTKASELHDEASLQYQNIFKETYVIVLDESKQEFIDTYTELSTYDTSRSVIANYADTQVQLTSSNVEVISKTDIKKVKINGLNAAITEIDAHVEGVKPAISYFFTYIEGEKNLYMIMAWTLQDKKETHRADFDQMVRTFRILKKAPATDL